MRTATNIILTLFRQGDITQMEALELLCAIQKTTSPLSELEPYDAKKVSEMLKVTCNSISKENFKNYIEKKYS